MKINTLLIVFILIGFDVDAQKNLKSLPANEPIPAAFIDNSAKIYLEENIAFLNARKQIYTTYGASFVLHAVIESQVDKKEDEISAEKVFEHDAKRLSNILLSKYKDLFSHHHIEFAKDKDHSDYTLTIKVFDHGFHWATNSAAGMFVRLKAELLSVDGKTVWEQYYMMDKNEAKIPYHCKAINMNKAIDKLIADFEKEPGLLVTTYEQISGLLAAKLLASASK